MKIDKNILQASSIAALQLNGASPLSLNACAEAGNQKNNVATKLLLFTTCYLLLAACKLFAQDLHFSQYNNAPLLINPANTGFSPDCDYRLGLNSRNQWAATNVPYKTTSVWADAQLFRNKIENGWLGLGAVVLNDVAGTGNLTSTKTYVNIAYHQLIDDDNLVSFAIGGGLVQKRIDYTKLVFDQQWNGTFFDISLPSNEPFVSNNVSYVDLSAGINYAWFASDNFYLNTGVSVLHLNTPQETFFNPATVDARLSRRYNFFVNASIKVNDALILNPHVYYSSISTSQETVIGFNGQYNLSGEGGNNQLLFGLHYRNKDAAIPSIGYQMGSLQLNVSYDATVSTLTNYSNYRSAYELSVLWKGIYSSTDKNAKDVKCPKF